MITLAALVGLFVILFLGWRLWWFFRDPERTAPPGDDVLAPADGFVVYTHRVRGGTVPIAIKHRREIPLEELIGLAPPATDGLLVGIFMTAWSVHVNRAPISGPVVRAVTRKPGRNRTMARMLTNLLIGRTPYEQDCPHLVENERHTIVIAGEIELAVTQIADIWVSSVLCHVGLGDRVERGARYGSIRMGSQVDVYIPDASRVELACVPGQAMRAGESVIARVRR